MSLYKFLPPDPDIVIANRKLRFTRPSGLNDPFELKPYFESIASDQEIADRFWKRFDIGAAFDKVYDGLPQEFRNAVTRLQFLEVVHKKLSEDHVDIEATIQKVLNTFFAMLPKLAEQARHELPRHFEQIGILSLTTDAANMHMWMHYAKAHTGFAIEFDETHPFFDQRRSKKDEFYHLRKVEYFDKLPVYGSMSEMDGTNIFCSKGSHCVLEKEWRMLVPLVKPTATSTIEEELVKFPEDALTAVIFGLHTESSFKQKMMEHLSANPAFAHVKLRQVVMMHKEGALAIKDI